MTDEQQIANQLYRYGFLIDAGDFDGIGRHLEHAVLTAEGATLEVRGAQAIADHYRKTTRLYPETGTPRTKHLFSNLLIEVDPDGKHAHSEANYQVLQQTDALPLQTIITGRYRHRYERRDGVWRIVSKHFFVDQVGDLSHHLLFDLEESQKSDPGGGA